MKPHRFRVLVPRGRGDGLFRALAAMSWPKPAKNSACRRPIFQKFFILLPSSSRNRAVLPQ
jgi:hypothetical protein